MIGKILIPALVGAVTGLVGLVVMYLYARSKGMKIGEGKKMGLNLTSGNACPGCGAAVPVARRPKNLRQALWGGWTCESCGLEFDKWLRPVDETKK